MVGATLERAVTQRQEAILSRLVVTAFQAPKITLSQGNVMLVTSSAKIAICHFSTLNGYLTPINTFTL